MENAKILVADPISPKGVDLLRAHPQFTVDVKTGLKEDALLPIIGEYDALIVRSQTKVNAKVIAAAKKLRVVGRAGVGVDNVDVDAATKRGIIVMNTPGGNTISTAEHTFSMMMALSRNIPQACASMKAGQWDRKSFEGVELFNKTLGVIGMGRIGGEVARRAIAFGMRVLAFDPFLSLSRAKALQVEVVDLEQIYAQADYITVHVPMTDQTKGMINRTTIAKMKKGVRLINCARGGIIHEGDLREAILAGHVAGAALDVYEVEPPPADWPLRALPQVILTPHLGASTHEAQESVGIEVAEQIAEVLAGGTIRNAVNMPSLDAKTLATLQPFLTFGEKMGRLVAQLASGRIERLVVEFCGKATELETNPITRSVLKGFLEAAEGSDVNYVNALVFAEQLGIHVGEVKSTETTDYTELITVRAVAEQTTSVAGTFYGGLSIPRLVRINDTPVEAVPNGVLFIFQNRDRPGVVGWIGTIMGKHGINIAGMSLGRDAPGGKALTVLNLDSAPSADVIAEIRADPDIMDVKVARL